MQEFEITENLDFKKFQELANGWRRIYRISSTWYRRQAIISTSIYNESESERKVTSFLCNSTLWQVVVIVYTLQLVLLVN